MSGARDQIVPLLRDLDAMVKKHRKEVARLKAGYTVRPEDVNDILRVERTLNEIAVPLDFLMRAWDLKGK